MTIDFAKKKKEKEKDRKHELEKLALEKINNLMNELKRINKSED